MRFDKAGLFQGRDLYPDVMLNHYKPYNISQEDFKHSYEKFDVCLVETNKTLKILNGTLYLDKLELDITNKDLGYVLTWLKEKGVEIALFENALEILKLPAITLVESNNTTITSLDGDISPLDLSYVERSFTVNSLESKILSSIVVNKDKTKVTYPVNSRLFYEPSLDTKVHLAFLSTKFYLQVDFSPKRSKNDSVTELLNYGESNV